MWGTQKSKYFGNCHEDNTNNDRTKEQLDEIKNIKDPSTPAANK